MPDAWGAVSLKLFLAERRSRQSMTWLLGTPGRKTRLQSREPEMLATAAVGLFPSGWELTWPVPGSEPRGDDWRNSLVT